MVTVFCCGDRNSASPVGSSVGKAHDMYPSVVNSLMGESPTCGQDTVVSLGAADWRSYIDFLMLSSSVIFLTTTGTKDAES